MKGQTRAAILTAPRKFEITNRARPVAGTNEVVVRIAATAVCHTDLEIYTGRHPGVRYPVIMGHEATGTIDSVGPQVTGLKPGQNVLINPVITCGRCDSCLRGAENLCRNAGLFGREIEGSMSQYARLGARYVYPLPAHLPLAEATLIETLATVRHAQEHVPVLFQGEVSIIGSRALTPDDITHSIDLVAAGKIDVSGFVTTTYPLDHAAAAFEDYERNPGRILRIVIDSSMN